METRTPVTNMKDSSSSSGRGRHGCVVLCSGNDVQIKLGSSSNLVMQPPHHVHNHHPHQVHQQENAHSRELATADTDVIRLRARSPLSHVQPSAPGEQTLQRPWSARSNDHGADSSQQNPIETSCRPPPFNPNTSVGAHAEALPSDEKTSQAALKDMSADGVDITSTSGDGKKNKTLPPSYDELYGDQKDDRHCQQQQQEEEKQQQTSSVTGTTTDDVCPASLPCVVKFGQYIDPNTSPQPGLFTNPTRISVRVDQSDHGESPSVMVVDQSTSSVHVFTSTGDCVSVLRVPHVSGGCFIGAHPPPLVLLAVGTSVSAYEMDGRLVKEIPLRGRQQDAVVLTTVPYGDRGFVAVRSHSLSICRGGVSRPAVVHTLAGRHRADRGTTPFVNVVDVAVDSRRARLIVLDGANPPVSRHRTAVYVMTEDGAVLQAIRPAHDPRCGPLLCPFAIAIDQAANVLISDAGRVIQFSGNDGRYLATLIGDATTAESGQPRGSGTGVQGIAVGSIERKQVVFAVLSGERFAQIRAFALQTSPRRLQYH